MAAYDTQTVDTLFEKIAEAEHIVIAGHINPDGDAIGSCFGMALAIAASSDGSKRPAVLLEKYSQKFDSCLRGGDMVYRGDYAASALPCDLFIAIDTSTKERLGEAVSVFDRAGFTFCIDHHISNNGYANCNIIRADASSACEIVYDLINGRLKIDKDAATALYAGILTDTGGFRHQSTSPETMLAAADLMRHGIDFTDIHRKLLHIKTPVELAIASRAQSKMVVEGKLCYTFVTIDDMKETGADYIDLDGIVESILNVEGVECSVFLNERPNGVKASFRSVHIDVNKVASSFGGGGHIHASGATILKPIEEAMAAVLDETRKELGNND